MLIQPDQEKNARSARSERRLWHHESRHTPSIGCERCPEKGVCGGLRVDHALYDCLGFCCGKPDECDKVCRNRTEAFVRSVREVGGFDLANVPRAPLLQKPSISSIVPVVYHAGKRGIPFRAATVCLPLYDVIARHDGVERFSSKSALAEKYGVREDASIILTGTDVDRPLERWWSLSEKRLDEIRALKGLGVALVTSPNFSLFTDRPRWDDLHSMKRIAIAHEEFLREGIVAALHLNARTEQDWERWKRYLADRPEITHVAVEFATGAGWGTRTAWHIEQMTRLAREVGRPLHLVLRGGSRALPALASAFQECTFLETTVFLKTEHRQRAVLSPTGKIKWYRSPTKNDETVDALLKHNWQVVADFYADLLQKFGEGRKAA